MDQQQLEQIEQAKIQFPEDRPVPKPKGRKSVEALKGGCCPRLILSSVSNTLIRGLCSSRGGANSATGARGLHEGQGGY